MLSVTSIPFFMHSPIIRAKGTPALSENSFTVRNDGIETLCPVRSTNICFTSSIFFSRFSTFDFLFRRNPKSSSALGACLNHFFEIAYFLFPEKRSLSSRPHFFLLVLFREKSLLAARGESLFHRGFSAVVSGFFDGCSRLFAG